MCATVIIFLKIIEQKQTESELQTSATKFIIVIIQKFLCENMTINIFKKLNEVGTRENKESIRENEVTAKLQN